MTADADYDRLVDQACSVVEPAFATLTSPTRDELLQAAMSAWAPATVLALLNRLPTQTYDSVDEIRLAFRAQP